jgi:hypothetical protein
MRERERLGSLLESYEAAIGELTAWDDPAVSDLIIRLGVWRAAIELELMFADERKPVLV